MTFILKRKAVGPLMNSLAHTVTHRKDRVDVFILRRRAELKDTDAASVIPGSTHLGFKEPSSSSCLQVFSQHAGRRCSTSSCLQACRVPLLHLCVSPVKEAGVF